jgi:hypothetical protein
VCVLSDHKIITSSHHHIITSAQDHNHLNIFIHFHFNLNLNVNVISISISTSISGHFQFQLHIHSNFDLTYYDKVFPKTIGPPRSWRPFIIESRPRQSCQRAWLGPGLRSWGKLLQEKVTGGSPVKSIKAAIWFEGFVIVSAHQGIFSLSNTRSMALEKGQQPWFQRWNNLRAASHASHSTTKHPHLVGRLFPIKRGPSGELFDRISILFDRRWTYRCRKDFMIWSDMLSHDMTWSDMIWYHMICYDMTWNCYGSNPMTRREIKLHEIHRFCNDISMKIFLTEMKWDTIK